MRLYDFHVLVKNEAGQNYSHPAIITRIVRDIWSFLERNIAKPKIMLANFFDQKRP